MLQLNVANPTEPVLRVLQRNPNLASVSLQVQPDHSVVEIISALGELRHLRKLCIEGSNVVGGTPITLHNPTDVVLHILHTCRHLQELVYSDLPWHHPLPVFHISADFMFTITRLDLSGIKRGQWTTTLPVEGDESGCHEVILRCPGLQWLSFPRELRPQEVIHLKTRLAKVCCRLTRLVFTELVIAELSQLLASYKTLTHLTFVDCLVTPESLQRWAANPRAITTIEEVHITYGLLGKEMAEAVLKVLHAPVGTIEFDSSKKIASWKRSFSRHARQQS
jgi:hypothetical protein